MSTTYDCSACRRLSAQNWPISLSDVTSEYKKKHFLSLKKGNNKGIIGVVLIELWGKTKEFKNRILGKTGGMKGTKVQTLGVRAVAGAWCMAGWLGHNNNYGHGCNY